MPARLRLSWGMKTLKLFLLPVLASVEFAWQVIRYALIFVSAFFRQRASLGCEMVAMRSQLTFYVESIRQKRQPRPCFNPAFRLLWVLLSSVWSGWKFAAELMKPKTVLQWHEHAFLQWWRWKSRRKGGGPVSRGNWDCRSQNGPPLPLAKSVRGKIRRHPTARAIGSRDSP